VGQAAAPVTAFVDVAVIPMDRERMLAHQTVVVRGDRIVALGPTTATRVPAEAVRVDGRGKFLIPGLADMHAHIPGWNRMVVWDDGAAMFTGASLEEAERMLFLNVANGVTTLRLMHGWPGSLALRHRAAQGELLSPRLYVARRAIELGGEGWADSAGRIVADVEAAKAAGYDLIKVHGAIRAEGAAHDSLVAVARRVGIPIAGHPPGSAIGDQGLEVAMQHYASIEHLERFNQYLTGGGANEPPYSFPQTYDLGASAGKLQALAVAMQRAGVWNCPTLVALDLVFDRGRGPEIAQWPELRYLRETNRQRTLERLASQRADSVPIITVAARRQIIQALRDAGAGLLLGTDAAFEPLLPGFAVHRELEALVRAGLTPYEALATGTRNVAAYFGTLDSTGTVAVGQRADLVLLAANPLEDIRHTMQVAGVLLGGRWLPRAELDARLAALEGTVY
jgi:cytosine/adenosine deaminase-related metal-dependent hydrolase